MKKYYIILCGFISLLIFTLTMTSTYELTNTAQAQSYNNEGTNGVTNCVFCNKPFNLCICEDPNVDVCACNICKVQKDCDLGCPFCSSTNETGISNGGTLGDLNSGSTVIAGDGTIIGDGTVKDSGTGGSTTTPPTSNCTCCGKNPCVCSSAILRIADANNPFRFVETGGTLVMVTQNNSRSANISLSSTGNILYKPGYPMWSYPLGYFSGQSNLSRAFESSGSFNVTLGPNNCRTLTGGVKLVPQNYQSLSISANLNEVASKFNTFLSSKTAGANFNCGLSLSGTIITKKVDKYLDGSQTGGYTDFEAKASATFGGNEMKIYVYNLAPISAYVKLRFDGLSCSGDLHFTKDESRANPDSGSGSLSIGIAGAKGELVGEVGLPYICSAGITGQINMTPTGIKGTASMDASRVKLSAKMSPTTITANCYIFAKDELTDTVCKKKLGQDVELFKTSVEADLGSITVYTFNN